jgi:GSH-dependent disulfide-bond oxidoreductase
MIDLHTAATPNGKKISIALEELELPYRVIAHKLGQGELATHEYARVNPNQKIPAIVDHDGDVRVFESGAILIYLAEKAGRLLAPSGAARAEALGWLMFQMSAVGPIFGQLNHFMGAAPEKLPYAIERFRSETMRILGVLERQLAEREHLAGDYSIADIATFPWVDAAMTRLGDALRPGLPSLSAWHARVAARPAVARGMNVPHAA